MTKRVYVVGGDIGYANWLDDYALARRIQDASLVLFTGGADVSPYLYNKSPHPSTDFNTNRDEYETEQFEKARKLETPMLGICRGQQFLCVMAGGILVQDMRHNYIHPIITNDGKELLTNSMHHQRACLKGIENKTTLLAWAPHISPYSYGESYKDKMDEEKEAEVVFYNDIQALGIQGHPEMLMYGDGEWRKVFIDYCRSLVTERLE